MKITIVFSCIFLAGVLAGSLNPLPNLIEIEGIKTVIVDVLLLLIGIGVGSDAASLTRLKSLDRLTFLVPFLIAAGSILGTGLVAFLLPLVGFRSGLAVGAGFGFYSLSSIILTDLQGAQLGAIALIANLTRELFTILFAPLLVKFFGQMAPIASAAATSMDITLPVIQRFSGAQYTLIAILSGVILTILVPILVPIFGGDAVSSGLLGLQSRRM